MAVTPRQPSSNKQFAIATAMRKLPGLLPEREGDIDSHAASLVGWVEFALHPRGKDAPTRFKQRSATKALAEIEKFEGAAKRFLLRLNALSAGAFGSLDSTIADHNRNLSEDASAWVHVPHLLMLRNQIELLNGHLVARAKVGLQQRPSRAGKRSAGRGQLLAAAAAREFEFFTGRPADQQSDALIFLASELFNVFGCSDSPPNCVRGVVDAINRGDDPFETFGAGPVKVSVVKCGSKN
jgi:hypothetical protein